MKIYVTERIIADTLRFLQKDGLLQRESVALWLGRRAGGEVRVVDAVRPEHQAGRDFFHIPAPAMGLLRARLRDENLMIAAQVHTHPREAFHSPADNRWAIVRHVGALSLVLPHFAQRIAPGAFWTETAFFAMSDLGEWCRVDARDHVEVTP
jgi:hypothetical protein